MPVPPILSPNEGRIRQELAPLGLTLSTSGFAGGIRKTPPVTMPELLLVCDNAWKAAAVTSTTPARI